MKKNKVVDGKLMKCDLMDDFCLEGSEMSI